MPFDITDPYDGLDLWMQQAAATEPRVPDAMQVATVDADGPSVRTVLLKGWHRDTGLVFYTNLGSRKGRQLGLDPRVGFVLHHKSRERQILGRGAAQPVSSADADAYWASRPRGSQLGAWASRQSEVIAGPDALADAMAQVSARFEGRPVPRPDFWSGFAIRPVELEFWQGRPDRLHHRIRFTLTGEQWTRSVLAP